MKKNFSRFIFQNFNQSFVDVDVKQQDIKFAVPADDNKLYFNYIKVLSICFS